jgi:outer membrane protein assembly factor BamB
MGIRWWRWGALAAVMLIAAAAIIHRVIAPAELLTPARNAYPAEATQAEARVIGTLIPAPLIVDGRLRVYAAARQVRADLPIDARTPRTPYWSYRRWPAQLSGVVAAGATVISRWSDGELVALDARSGRIAWRARGPRPDQGYTGRRTGAATLYTPPGLYTGTGGDGREVLLVSGAAALVAYDLATGRELWRTSDERSCRSDGFTSTAGSFVALNGCGATRAVVLYDLTTGAVTTWRPEGAGDEFDIEPVGCRIGRSRCPALRTTDAGNVRGWALERSGAVAAPLLDRPDAEAVGDVAVAVEPAGSDDALVVGRSLQTGVELWRHGVPAGTRVLAAQPGRLHLLTPDRRLITLDVADGAELSEFSLAYGHDPLDWEPGLVHASDGFIAIERLARPVDADAGDSQYYLDIQPVLLAGT